MPVVPGSVIEPIWAQFSALLPAYPPVAPTPPLGCHRRGIPDRVVVDQVVAALVHGSGSERIAPAACSDRTIRRRLHEWSTHGLTDVLHRLVLEQYDRLIGLELDDLVVDGCITTAPGGGDMAGRSPVDRGKLVLKRSTMTDGAGVPLAVVAAGANRHDAPLLEPTLAGADAIGFLPPESTIHLDRGYAGRRPETLLAHHALVGVIARKGVPTPLQVGQRWVVERPQSWMNGFGKLRRCTEKRAMVVRVSLSLAADLMVTRCLIREARTRYRWDGRPITRRLT